MGRGLRWLLQGAGGFVWLAAQEHCLFLCYIVFLSSSMVTYPQDPMKEDWVTVYKDLDLLFIDQTPER